MERLSSQDGIKATIRYTQVWNGNDKTEFRYFAVPDNAADYPKIPFCPGFFRREEAVEWWKNAVARTAYKDGREYGLDRGADTWR